MGRKKPENMSLEEVRAELAKQSEVLDQLFEEQAAINRKISARVNRKKALQDAEADLLVASGDAGWEYLLYMDNAENKYKILNERLRAIGLMQDGYWPDIMQYAVRIALHRDKEGHAEEVCKGLKEVLPFVKPRVEKVHAGLKMIDIFESSLSRYGIYYLTVNEEASEYKVAEYSGRRATIHFEGDNLLEAVKFVQEKVWYERDEPEDEEDDDCCCGGGW